MVETQSEFVMEVTSKTRLDLKVRLPFSIFTQYPYYYAQGGTLISKLSVICLVFIYRKMLQ